MRVRFLGVLLLALDVDAVGVVVVVVAAKGGLGVGRFVLAHAHLPCIEALSY